MRSIISFVIAAAFGFSCSPRNQKINVEVLWDQHRAIGLRVENFEGNLDSIEVRLIRDQVGPPILGEVLMEDKLVFSPMIPFTRGFTYAIYNNRKEIARVEIPRSSTPPRITAVYPADTVPENLLKIHVDFSQPMREGQAWSKINLFNLKGDTMRGTFLFLKTELWNDDRTSLTMWLDPGRIKRGLIPNEKMGVPLAEGQFYILKIDSLWEDESGLNLPSVYSKKIFVTSRDSLSPKPSGWEIVLPGAQTNEPLKIDFREELDDLLLRECVQVFNKKEEKINGTIESNGKVVNFIPEQLWTPGRYMIRIESRLEDLAGNNLNRPFDRAVNDVPASEMQYVQLEFHVK